MMNKVLEVNIQQAGYHDRSRVVEGIEFSMQGGELIGLIGPNGAGKSTTIKAMLGLLQNMQGTIAFCGPNQNYGYIPETPILYDKLTLWEHLELAASAHGMDEQIFLSRTEALLAQFHLTDVKHDLPGSFSKGMQQKIMLIIGFLLQPDVYIVDEPFIGLDPLATRDFLRLLEQEKARGAGILMSTHVLDTAEKICDSFLLVNQGSMLARGTLQEIREQCGLPEASLFECFIDLTQKDAQ